MTTYEYLPVALRAYGERDLRITSFDSRGRPDEWAAAKVAIVKEMPAERRAAVYLELMDRAEVGLKPAVWMEPWKPGEGVNRREMPERLVPADPPDELMEYLTGGMPEARPDAADDDLRAKWAELNVPAPNKAHYNEGFPVRGIFHLANGLGSLGWKIDCDAALDRLVDNAVNGETETLLVFSRATP